MNKIIMLIIETCDQNYLAEIMIEYTTRFEDVLKKPFAKARDSEDPTQFYILVKEK